MTNTRKEGYYWVNSKFKLEFRPRYYNGNQWLIDSSVYVSDDFWLEIDERRIERPSPQQQPDTFVQDETQIVRGPLGPTYATKLVRGQPDDLSKALTRIKELETALGAVRGYIGMATWEYVDQYRECLEIIDNAI